MIEVREDHNEAHNYVLRARGVSAFTMAELAAKLRVPEDELVLLVSEDLGRRERKRLASKQATGMDDWLKGY